MLWKLMLDFIMLGVIMNLRFYIVSVGGVVS